MTIFDKQSDFDKQSAKEAAKEAEEMTDDIGIASQSDVKSAARESVNIKWQRRWEVSEKGRHLFTHRPGSNQGRQGRH